jgi:hypothetical protein
MSEHDSDQPVTFTWATPDGKSYEVEAAYDVDTWTGREMRAVDRMCDGAWSKMGASAKAGIIYALSVARVVPGATIEVVDDQMTVGRIREINRQINERDAARRKAEPDTADVEDMAALSPTSAGSEA